MSGHAVLLVGGPDSGKTNFVTRLWPALREGEGDIVAKAIPDNVKYVEDNLAFVLEGKFAPRTERLETNSTDEFSIEVGYKDRRLGGDAKLVIPDVKGELWKTAVETSEVPAAWLERMQGAEGALLFVRAHSDQNVDPLDWVTASELLAVSPIDPEAAKALPTQVFMCELVRFLEYTLSPWAGGSKPRLAVIIAAWDLLDGAASAAGPWTYLREQYPLFYGKLMHCEKLEIEVFGASILGGDPENDDAYKERFLANGLSGSGYVVTQADGAASVSPDMTLPLKWLLSV